MRLAKTNLKTKKLTVCEYGPCVDSDNESKTPGLVSQGALFLVPEFVGPSGLHFLNMALANAGHQSPWVANFHTSPMATQHLQGPLAQL